MTEQQINQQSDPRKQKQKLKKNISNSNLHYILQNEKQWARKLRKAKENNPNEQKNSNFEIKKHFVYPLKKHFK